LHLVKPNFAVELHNFFGRFVKQSARDGALAHVIIGFPPALVAARTMATVRAAGTSVASMRMFSPGCRRVE
jgi:hypothetical protein